MPRSPNHVMTTISSESLYVRRDRIAGGLMGLLIGDALGVPYEFHPPHRLPPPAAIEFSPPVDFPRSHGTVPPGTWSDDGAQALCLLASLLHRQRLDLGDFSRRLVNWMDFGYMAVDGDVFDVGMQTARAIAALRDGTPPDRSGPVAERDNGNGSLMRVLPLALWHRGDDTELAVLAAAQSLPTHGHPRSQVACAMACLWARATLADHPSAWECAAEALRPVAEGAGLPRDEIERVLDPANERSIEGSGYVVDTLWSARHALSVGHDYESVVRSAIALGHDTDTTAAVAGGIAGIRHGLWASRCTGALCYAAKANCVRCWTACSMLQRPWNVMPGPRCEPASPIHSASRNFRCHPAVPSASPSVPASSRAAQ